MKSLNNMRTYSEFFVGVRHRMSLNVNSNRVTIYGIVFFLASYLINLNLLKNMVYAPVFILLIVFFLLFFRNNFLNYKLSNYHIYIILYIILLGSSFVISTFFSIDPLYSLTRILFTLIIFSLSFYFFWHLCDSLYVQQQNMNLWETAFVLFAILIIIGQIIFPEWRSGIGGIRMSGGTNPNFISFFAFFIMITIHFKSIGNGWSKRRILLWILSIIIIAWSMSRSVLLSIGVLWFCYGMILTLKQLTLLVKGKLKRKYLAIPFVFISVVTFLFLVWKVFMQTSLIDIVIRRVTSLDGWESRMAAWKVLWPYFTENIWFGTAGWWNATHIISENWRPGMASSPHNLYVRLLAEVGIVGTSITIALPLVLLILLLFNCLREFKVDRIYNQSAFLASTLLSILIGQFFEDRYLVSVAGLGNSIIIFCIVLSFHYLIKAKKYNGIL